MDHPTRNDIMVLLLTTVLYFCSCGRSTPDSPISKAVDTLNHSESGVTTPFVTKTTITSSTVSQADLFGKWKCLWPIKNLEFETFIIDSSGLHNKTAASTSNYGLKIAENRFIILDDTLKFSHLITRFSKDTMKIYWTTGHQALYARVPAGQ